MSTVLNQLPVGLISRPDLYQWLENVRSNDPVCFIADLDGQPGWLVTGYSAARQALSDRRLSSVVRSPTSPTKYNDHISRRTFPGSMFTSDPPDHTRLKRAVTGALTRRTVREYQIVVNGFCEALLRGVDSHRTVDLVSELAEPLTAMTICTILGIPASDAPAIISWSHALMTEPADDAAIMISRAGDRKLSDYITRLLLDAEVHPTGGLIDSWLFGPQQARLTESELRTMIALLLVAGHETSVGLISSSILNLLLDYTYNEMVRHHPENLATAVEEIVRFDGPVVTTVRRFATTDFTLAGQRISPGDQVVISPAAANRDPATFSRPQEKILGRQPNPHLGFGYGIHRCPGADLGRMESGVALQHLISRFPKMKLSVARDQLTWRRGKVRCLAELPVELI
ncbi:cytochrome P450 [Nocardia brasiliensis]